MIGIAALAVLIAIGALVTFRPGDGARGPTPTVLDVPTFDGASMEPRVAEFIGAARERVLADLKSAEAWGLLGVAHDAHDLHAPALVCYRVARRLDPGEFRWAYYLGRVLEFLGEDPAEIIEHYEAASRLRPDYAPLFVRLGDALQRQNRFEDARRSYEKALALDRNAWLAHRGLGQSLLALDRASEAVTSLERATALEPQDGAAHASLARARLRAGDRAGAEMAAARSRELQPMMVGPDPAAAEIGAAGRSGGTCFKRAQELLDLGRAAEAIQNLQIAEEVMPDNPHVQVRWGRSLQRLGKRAEAVERYERALALKDDLDDVHLQAGLLLTAEGRSREAIPHFQKALRTLDDAATRAAFGSAIAQAGDLQRAVGEFETARQRGDLDASALNNWGSVLARLGDFRGAAARFQEAVAADPKSASARFNWGRALEDGGDLSGALAQYEAAARIDPRGPAAARLRELSASSQN